MQTLCSMACLVFIHMRFEFNLNVFIYAVLKFRKNVYRSDVKVTFELYGRSRCLQVLYWKKAHLLSTVFPNGHRFFKWDFSHVSRLTKWYLFGVLLKEVCVLDSRFLWNRLEINKPLDVFRGLRPVLEGFVVPMHEGACKTGSQIPRTLARGIWRTVRTSPSALGQQTPTDRS